MHDRSGSEADSKQNPSVSQGPLQRPAFEPRLVLDSMAGIFSTKNGYAKMVLRTVDGSEFECFVDGITARAWSDKLLALAGHLILEQRGGDSPDLRPLSELHEDDDEDPPPPPAGAAAPQSFEGGEK